MIRIFARAALVSILAIASSAAVAVPVFNINVNGALLHISTNVPNHSYPNAGIRVNTNGYTVITSPAESLGVLPGACTSLSNGFCQFTASTSPTTILIQGPGNANVNVTVCLNARGPLSCQSLTFWYNGDV